MDNNTNRKKGSKNRNFERFEKPTDLRTMTKSKRNAEVKRMASQKEEENEVETEETDPPTEEAPSSVEIATTEISKDDKGFIQIDGSFKEGGGQILRNCTSLSAILQKPIRITSIRAGRVSGGGLKAQHLTGIELVAQMHSATLTGNQLASTEISFDPKEFTAGKYVADTQTAGAITLIIQVALPCMLCGSKTVTVDLKGGTNVPFAPQIDYITHVFKPLASKMGIDFTLDIKNRGYFPKGGGQVSLKVEPVRSFTPITLLDRGDVESVYIRAYVAGSVEIPVGQRVALQAHKLLHAHFGNGVKFETEVVKEPKATGNGIGIMLVAKTTTGCILGASALGEKAVTAEKVGTEAAKELINNAKKGGCVDEYMQDQLIIFCALAKGISKIKTGPLTMHTETSIHFAQLLTGATFKISKVPKEFKASTQENSYIIECEGIGWDNPHFHKQNQVKSK